MQNLQYLYDILLTTSLRLCDMNERNLVESQDVTFPEDIMGCTKHFRDIHEAYEFECINILLRETNGNYIEEEKLEEASGLYIE